jgi:hypothetical protein
VGETIDRDHVQLAMPAGQEAAARAFYSGVLGLTEEVLAAGFPPTTDEPLEGFDRVY